MFIGAVGTVSYIRSYSLGVIYLRVNHVGPIMEEVNYLCNHCRRPLSLEEWRAVKDNNQHQLQRIAETLERLLKISEMRP